MKRAAWIFPGQGAQYVGMGRDFAESYSLARETFEEAEDLLKRSLSNPIFYGPESELRKTGLSQLAIFIVSLAILRVVESLLPGFRPQLASGLSLGEYTALAAVKALSFEEGLFLVDRRGRLMAEACDSSRGAMAALIGLPAREVEALVEALNMAESLWIANYNCPGQLVISGTEQAVAKAVEAAKERGVRRALFLAVQGAFHSGLMRPAEERFQPLLCRAKISAPEAPVVSNLSGSASSDPEQIRRHLLEQMTRPVLWEQSVRSMVSSGVSLFMEIGPGRTLSGLVKKTHPPAETLSISSVGDLTQLEKLL